MNNILRALRWWFYDTARLPRGVPPTPANVLTPEAISNADEVLERIQDKLAVLRTLHERRIYVGTASSDDRFGVTDDGQVVRVSEYGNFIVCEPANEEGKSTLLSTYANENVGMVRWQ